jgi:hypothetical protein
MGRGVVIPVLAAAAALACPPAADAAYVTGRQEWSVLSAAGKIGWATGFVDGAFSLRTSGDLHERHVFRCLVELGTSGAEVASLVEGGYKDARSAELPAAVVAWSEIREMCLGKVNRYRNEMGLRPLDP